MAERAAAGPATTGREQQVDVVEPGDHALPEPLSGARSDQARAGARHGRSGRACGCVAAARAGPSPSARRRRAPRPSSGRSPPSRGAGGDRRVPADDGVSGLRQQRPRRRRRRRASRRPPARRAPARVCSPRSAAGEPAQHVGPAAPPPAPRGRRRRRSTVVARAPLTAMPDQSSNPMSAGTTPRPGLSVTSPQAAAGSRSEPMPSLPCASGTEPEATAAALPPERPGGRASGVPGVAGDRAGPVGGAVEAELRHAGDADDDGAGRAQPGHDRMVGRRGAARAAERPVGARPRPRRRRCP